MPPAKTSNKYVQFRLSNESYKRLQLVSIAFEKSPSQTIDILLDAMQVPKFAEVDGMVNKDEILRLANNFNANLMIDSAMSREEHRSRYLRDSGFGEYNPEIGNIENTPDEK